MTALMRVRIPLARLTIIWPISFAARNMRLSIARSGGSTHIGYYVCTVRLPFIEHCLEQYEFLQGFEQILHVFDLLMVGLP